MYWFLNVGENVDTIQFDTLEDYRDWYQKNHGIDRADMQHTGIHFKR
jgi:uncharacterized NAD(P)/FAD-binding protein YdhS